MSTVRKHAKQRGDIASSQIYKDLNSDREGGRDLYFWRHILPLSVPPPPPRVNGPRAARLEADGGLLLSGAES